MKRFTNAGRQALKDHNLYAALSLALIVPDICSSLEDPGPGKSRDRYIKWCKEWVEPKFTKHDDRDNSTTIYLSALECYQLRCSIIHSGVSELNHSKQVTLQKIEFFDDNCESHLGRVEGLIFNGVLQPNFLQLKASIFSNTLFDAADEWDVVNADNPAVQIEKSKLLLIHSRGVAIGGILFG